MLLVRYYKLWLMVSVEYESVWYLVVMGQDNKIPHLQLLHTPRYLEIGLVVGSLFGPKVIGSCGTQNQLPYIERFGTGEKIT